jgi:GNAT superfamily N-acetyltransferase
VSKRQAETNGDTIEIFPVNTQQDTQSIDQAFENDSAIYEIDEPESVPIGSQEEIDDEILEDEDIVVDSEVRGKMVGVSLIKELIEISRKKGCYRITLFCNKKLINFYSRNGFKVNNVIMKKYLSEV